MFIYSSSVMKCMRHTSPRGSSHQTGENTHSVHGDDRPLPVFTLERLGIQLEEQKEKHKYLLPSRFDFTAAQQEVSTFLCCISE